MIRQQLEVMKVLNDTKNIYREWMYKEKIVKILRDFILGEFKEQGMMITLPDTCFTYYPDSDMMEIKVVGFIMVNEIFDMCWLNNMDCEMKGVLKNGLVLEDNVVFDELDDYVVRIYNVYKEYCDDGIMN